MGPQTDADIAAGQTSMDGDLDSSIVAEASDVGSDALGEAFSDQGEGDEGHADHAFGAPLHGSLLHSSFTGAFDARLAHIVEDVRESEAGSSTEDGSAVGAAALEEEKYPAVAGNVGGDTVGAENDAHAPAATAKNVVSPLPAEENNEGAAGAAKDGGGEGSKAPEQPKFKFRYDPLDFEKDYYNSLFRHAKGNTEGSILPPKEAAQLFLTSGIPWERLRMIWNMAVLPARPYPPGTKPPPAMTLSQFQSAVRLIQLFQNRITAKDERLRVTEGVVMAPAFFAGVSGAVVPLPWKDAEPPNGAKMRSRRRHSGSKVVDPVPSGENAARRQSKLSTSSSSLSHSTREEKKASPLVREARMVAFGAEDEYAMSQNEFLTYQETFARHCVSEANGPQLEQHVYVDEAVQLFTKSGLDRDTLGRLWDVVVSDPDAGKLDEEEFVLLTHLIVCVTRRGLAVPTELPAPLRVWRKNRFVDQGDNSHKDEVKAQNGAHHNEFVPTKALDDGQRIKHMEAEIWSLKGMVESLTAEVRELKKTIHNETNNQPQRPQYGAPPNDDVPNVDVEWYINDSERTDDYGYENSAFEHSSSFQPTDGSLGIRKPQSTATPPAPKTRHPAADRRSSPSLRSAKGMSKGMSQNIPPMHPSSGTKTPRRKQPLYQSMPQARVAEEAPAVAGVRGKVAQSMTTGSKGNLASQMQQVQRQDKFDSLLQRTMERMGSDAGSAAGSNVGSHASSRRDHSASFKPAQLNRNLIARRQQVTSRRGAHMKRSLVDSARHIKRRMSGETEIYEMVEPPSTAAVDLPPL